MKQSLLCCLASGFLTNSLIACGPYFFAAPPVLEAYIERFGIQTLTEMQEASQVTGSEPVPLTNLADALITGSETIAEDLDAALKRNRAHQYDAGRANILIEFKELVPHQGHPQLPAYLRWRLAEARSQIVPPFAQDPVLEPHFLVQAAAAKWRADGTKKSLTIFLDVCDRYSEHPRAEIARFMIGRVHLRNSRKLAAEAKREWRDPNQDSQVRAARASAIIAFHEYEKRYPNGRFLPDVNGWLGAIASDRGHVGQALQYYISQLDAADHPEIKRSAWRECERCLKTWVRHLGQKDQAATDLPWESVIAHPELVNRVIYLLLDPDSRTDFRDYPYYELSIDDVEQVEDLRLAAGGGGGDVLLASRIPHSSKPSSDSSKAE